MNKDSKEIDIDLVLLANTLDEKLTSVFPITVYHKTRDQLRALKKDVKLQLSVQKEVKEMKEAKDVGITSDAMLQRILKGKEFKPKTLKKSFQGKHFRFGVVSDTHFCSIHEKIHELHEFYAHCKRQGVDTVVNAGDIVAGWGIYKGQENEVHTYGADAQIAYVVKNYPKVKGIKTAFITGNHDLSWWNRSGVDIGAKVAEQREDMVYLGQYEGFLNIGGVKIQLSHPDGGGAYALSYNAQKIAEQIPSGKKPHILIFGHWHTSHYFSYRNIHILNAGCFEGQSLFLKRKGINPVIGGWIIDIEVADDAKKSIISFAPQFFQDYE